MSGWRSRTRAAVASTAARSETSQISASPPVSSATRAEPVFASREENAVPAAAREPARDLGPDARRRSGDDRDLDHGRHLTRPLGSPGGRRLHRQARARARRRKQALDRVGDCAGARRRRRPARLHLPGRTHREERPRSRLDGRHGARHRVRRAVGRRCRARVRRGRERLRRRARHPRSLGRLRRRRGSRGPLHRHAARPLLARGRRERLFARRVRARRGAADGEGRRRLDRHDDVPRRRARGAALQRHGRREGNSRRVDALPRVGPRRRRTSASTRSRQARCERSPPARSPASRRWRQSSRSALRCTGM